MRLAKIEKVFAFEGQFLTPGMKVLDLRIDLSMVAAHDCPPVSFYRITLRDRAWVRRFNIAEGDLPEAGTEIALFSTTEDEPINGIPGRSVRFATVGIVLPSWGDTLP
jgi:hypothetical protein